MPSPALEFDFRRHFVADEGSSDCLGACFAMCSRYWHDRISNFQLPVDLDFWNSFLEKINSTTPKGNSTLRVLSVLRHQIRRPEEGQITDIVNGVADEEEEYVVDVIEGASTPPMVIKALTFGSIEETSGFLTHNPQIPLILCFDRSMAITRQEGGGHAVLLHSFDSVRENKVFVIDSYMTRFKEPYTIDLNYFKKGWEVMDNLAFAVYPRKSGISLNNVNFKKTSATLAEWGFIQ